MVSAGARGDGVLAWQGWLESRGAGRFRTYFDQNTGNLMPQAGIFML